MKKENCLNGGLFIAYDSSAAFGNEILEYTMKTLISGIEKEYKEIKDRQN